MLVSVMEYLFTQMVSLAGVHDRIAELGELGENLSRNGALGTSGVKKSLYHEVLNRRSEKKQSRLTIQFF